MLTIKRLYGQYVACFEHLDVNLDAQGFTSVTGENHDEPRQGNGQYESNGSGKTTLFDLLPLVGFQHSSKGLSKNKALNVYHPKDYHLGLEFERDGHQYRIDQYRRHKDHGTALHLHEDGKPVHAEGTKAIVQTQKRIEAALGLTLAEWMGFVYLAQRTTHKMVLGKPEEKRQYLTRVFGVDVLDAYDKSFSVFLSEQKAPLKDLAEIVDRIAALEKEAEVPVPTPEQLDQWRTRRSELQAGLDAATQQLAQQEVLRKRDALVPELEALSLTLRDQDAEAVREILRKETKKLARLEAGYAAYQRLHTVRSRLPDGDRPDVAALEKTSRRAQRYLSELAEGHARYQKRKALQEERAELSALDSEELRAVPPLTSHLMKLRPIQEQLAVVSSELKALSGLDGHANCPTCLQQVDASSLTEKKAERETQRDRLQTRAESLRLENELHEQHRRQARAYENWQARAAEYKDAPRVSSKDLAAAQADADAAQRALTQAQKYADVWDEYETLQKEVPEDEPRSKDVERQRSRVALLNQATAYDWCLTLPDAETLKAQQSALHEKLLKVQDKITTAKHLRAAAAQREEELKELRKKRRTLDSISQRTRTVEALRVAVADVKLARLKEATHVLTSVLPGYVSAFFPSKRVTIYIDESKPGKLDLIFEKGGKIIPLEGLSGGQAKRLSIAIVLSFTKLTAKTVNLLVADEPFTELDKTSRATCYELIRDAGVPTTLLTSHDADVLTQRYDQRWRVIMKNDVSRLKLR